MVMQLNEEKFLDELTDLNIEKMQGFYPEQLHTRYLLVITNPVKLDISSDTGEITMQTRINTNIPHSVLEMVMPDVLENVLDMKH